MALYKYNSEWLQERRVGFVGAILNSVAPAELGFRVPRRGRRFPRNLLKPRFFRWLLLLLLAALFFFLATFGLDYSDGQIAALLFVLTLHCS